MTERPSTETEMVENSNGPSQTVSCVFSFRKARIISAAKNRYQYEQMSLQDSAISSSSATSTNISQTGQGAQPLSNGDGNSAPSANSQTATSCEEPLAQPETINFAPQVVAEAFENAQRPPAGIASGEHHSSDQATAPSNITREISGKLPKAAHSTSLRRFILRAFSLPWPIAATILLIVVASITLRANSLNWPLARITPSAGIFLLAVFSKLTDFFFEWAADTVWEKMQWGPLMKGGEKLLTFLTLSAGLKGWMAILFLRHRPSATDSPSRMNIVGFFRYSSPRMWSLIR
jgi:hypothetical protein